MLDEVVPFEGLCVIRQNERRSEVVKCLAIFEGDDCHFKWNATSIWAGYCSATKIVTKLVPKRIVGQSLQDSLITGPLRVSSGIGGLSHLLVYYVISFHIGFNKIYSSILRLYNHMLYAIHVS